MITGHMSVKLLPVLIPLYLLLTAFTQSGLMVDYCCVEYHGTHKLGCRFFCMTDGAQASRSQPVSLAPSHWCRLYDGLIVECWLGFNALPKTIWQNQQRPHLRRLSLATTLFDFKPECSHTVIWSIVAFTIILSKILGWYVGAWTLSTHQNSLTMRKVWAPLLCGNDK